MASWLIFKNSYADNLKNICVCVLCAYHKYFHLILKAFLHYLVIFEYLKNTTIFYLCSDCFKIQETHQEMRYPNMTFLQRGRIASKAERCNSYGNSVRPSVRLSVRLSHAGTLPRQTKIESRSLNTEVAKTL